MSTEIEQRNIPVFEVNGTDEFYALKSFFSITNVLCVKTEKVKSKNGDSIIFYVINEDDKIKTINNIHKLNNTFNEYRNVIIRKHIELPTYHRFFLCTSVFSLKIKVKTNENGKTITFYVSDEYAKLQAVNNIKKLYDEFKDYNKIIIREHYRYGS